MNWLLCSVCLPSLVVSNRFISDFKHQLFIKNRTENYDQLKFSFIGSWEYLQYRCFFKAILNKSLDKKNKKCESRKHSNICLTGEDATNTTGDKLPMLVLGKIKHPIYFKGVKNKMLLTWFQAKSWMTSGIFDEWVLELDSKFYRQNQKVALIVYNCSAHTYLQNWQSVQLFFLPKKRISHL